MLRLAPLCLLLAACGNNDQTAGPDAMTMGEAKALDDAATMLAERSPPQDPAEKAEVP